MDFTDIADIQRELSQLGAVHVHLSEYRITHGYLELLLTDGNFVKRAKVYLTDCMFISGPTAGGPWQLTATVTTEAGQDVIGISTTNGEFTAKGLHTQLSIFEPG